MAEPFRLGIIMKQWQRPAVTAFCQRYLAALDVPGVEVVCASVRSPGDKNLAPTVEGWRYVSAPNRPLSPKGNAAALALKGKVDAVLNVGSDDLVSPGYIAAAVEAIKGGADYVLPEGLCFLDLVASADGQGLQAMAVRAPRIGAGRVLSARLLDTLHWHPWPVRGHDPDGDMDARLRLKAPGVLESPTRLSGMDIDAGLVVCDIKCGDNIGDYAGIRRRRVADGLVTDLDPGALLAALGISHEDYETLMADFRKTRNAAAGAPLRHARRAIKEIKINGTWYRPGTDREVVYVTDEEAAIYAHSLSAEPVGGQTIEAQSAAVKTRPDGRPRADVDASQAALESAGIPGAAPQNPDTGEPLGADVEASQAALEAAGIPGAAAQEPTPIAPLTRAQAAEGDEAAQAEIGRRSARTGYDDRMAKPASPPPPKPPAKATFKSTGGGWYEVRYPDGRTEKVQGKAAAEKAVKG